MKPKLCPFCGSTSLRLVGSGPASVTEHRVVCNGCTGQGPGQPSADKAVAAWNGEIIDRRNQHRRDYFERYDLPYPGDIEKRRSSGRHDPFRDFIDDELDMGGNVEGVK